MVKPQVLLETPITMTELKDNLVAIKARDSELNFRASKTEDYLNQINCILDSDSSKELKKKIEGLDVPRLKQEHIIKIVDILPVTEEHLKLIFSGYILTVSQANLKKIVDLVKEFTEKKA